MIKLIWRNWWRHKERFIIMLIGVFIVSSGLSLLFSLSESSHGTVMDTLQKKWKVSYDILVRPPGSNLTDPTNQLLEPNFQDGITGGITMQQWKQIKQIPDVDIAAPIAVVGYMSFNIKMPEYTQLDEFGIYKQKITVTVNNGLRDEVIAPPGIFIFHGPWNRPKNSDSMLYGVGDFYKDLTAFDDVLLAGVDPQEEARLVGLDKSIVSQSNSRYFQDHDKSTKSQSNDLPILMNNQPFVNKTFLYSFERLNLPFKNAEQANITMEKVKENGGQKYLEQVGTDAKKTYSFNSEQMYKQMLNQFSSSEQINEYITLKSTSLLFDNIKSPYPDRWLYTYQVQNVPLTDPRFQFWSSGTYRPFENYTGAQLIPGIPVSPHIIGFYDSTKLQLSKDPLTELPMETYQSPFAKMVFDDANHPVNPPTLIKPNNSPLGLLTNSPTMLTTVEAASNIMGDKPISVIRIKVKGVTDVSNESQKKLQQVVQAIYDQTGLQSDIMLDSAPQPVLIHVPASGTQQALGWIEQQWIKLGARFTMVQELKLGFTGILLLVMLVAVVYVLATNLVSFLVRKKEFALLQSLGWRQSQIIRLIVLEAVLVSAFVAIVTWAMEGYFVLLGKTDLSLTRFILIGLSGFFIYLLGAIITVFFIRSINPMHAFRTGEIADYPRRITKVRYLFQLALTHFIGKFKRNTLAILSITVPTTLLMFFLFVTLRLKGVFYTTWLGHYAVAEIGSKHYLAMGICLLISILTTAEIIWQNVSERKSEISLLKAMGWRNMKIRKLILWEGFIVGCLSGTIALIFGLFIIQIIYRNFPAHDLWYLTLIGMMPVLTGVIGSVLPAEMAVRIQPGRGMIGNYSTGTQSEKWLKSLLIVFIAILAIVAAASTYRIVTTHYPKAFSLVDSTSAKPSIQPTASSQKVGDLRGFAPKEVIDGSKASYELSLKMNEKGSFSAKAVIKASNTSTDEWDKMMFYMIPNIFSDPKSNFYRDTARLTIKEVKMDGQLVNYSLEGGTLSVPIQQKMLPGKEAVIEIIYDFTVPEKGIRYTKQDESYILAQWYPMLATYNHGWDIEPFTGISESYHTGFSDFTLKYELPEGYNLISSSAHDPKGTATSGQVDVKNVKELMVTVTKDMIPVSKMVGDVEIRVWGKEANKDKVTNAVQIAAEAFEFLNKHIGTYPHKQLDIIIGDLSSMEYPGVVTVGTAETEESLKHSLVHEMVHQWFYAVVSNDPYHDGWLDEGMTELTTSLYLNDFTFAQKFYATNSKLSNLPLSEYQGADIIKSLYAQPVMKFKDLFDSLGGGDKGITFLHTYFANYQYKQVSTDEFMRFTKAYFGFNDDAFFQDWLKRSKLVSE